MDLENKKDTLAMFLQVERKELDNVPTFYIIAFHQLFLNIAYMQDAMFDSEYEEDEGIIVGSQYKSPDFHA